MADHITVTNGNYWGVSRFPKDFSEGRGMVGTTPPIHPDPDGHHASPADP